METLHNKAALCQPAQPPLLEENLSSVQLLELFKHDHFQVLYRHQHTSVFCVFVIGISFCTVQKTKHGSRSVDCWWMICNLDSESLNTVFMWILGVLCQIKLDYAADTWTHLLPCTSVSMQASATGYFLWISILFYAEIRFFTHHTHLHTRIYIYSSHELWIFPTKIVVECKPQEFGKKTFA